MTENLASTNPSPHDKPLWRRMISSGARLILTIALAIGVAMALRAFVVAPYSIPSGSMENTLLIGDCVFGRKFDVNPEPGEIITFTDPENPARTLVKRVIATEGQTIDIQNGHLIIDSGTVSEPYAVGVTEALSGHASTLEDGITYPYTVPEGCIWVMGDNREHSADSRFFGPIDTTSVTSEVIFRYAPFDRIGDVR